MYDIELKNVKSGKKFGRVFLIAGLFFLIIFGYFFLGDIFIKYTLDSKVMSYKVDPNMHYSDGSTMYSPSYYYKVNEIEYVCTTNYSSSINPGNDNKMVYYDSKNPSKCVSEYSGSINIMSLIVVLIPSIVIFVGYKQIRDVNNRVKIITKLNETGKLVKGIPYTLEPSGMKINDRDILRPVVSYKLPTGNIVKLKGDARFDSKSKDEDGLVDIIIDEMNPDNYFIDFEINRITGNREEDYYKISEEERNLHELNNPQISQEKQTTNPDDFQKPYTPL